MSAKVMVSNLSALKAKYGLSRRNEIIKVAKELYAADKAQGLKTTLVDVSDATAMQKLGGRQVSDPASGQQNKRAVDAIYCALKPDYLVLVGGPDVIPHIALQNPLPDDGDSSVPGDLPYACEAPYSLIIKDFIGPTRVVGRLPDIAGARDPAYLLNLLRTVAERGSRSASDYAAFLGLSAKVWEDSTRTSLRQLFGPTATPHLSPPEGPEWTPQQLAALSHFINCHGAPADHRYYGQKGNSYPVAHDAAWVEGKLAKGTVVAAECCYGAQLYDPALDDDKLASLAITYLGNAAYGFFGSTTIAYGPASGNGGADLICQYFLKRVLQGASLGRAALEARQEFAQGAWALNPTDLKTLGQFDLLGDPSVHPVQKAPTHLKALGKAGAGMSAEQRDEAAARASRRRMLFEKGLAIAQTQPVAQWEREPQRSVSLERAIGRLLRENHLAGAEVASYRVVLPSARSLGSKSAAAAVHGPVPPATTFHVALQRGVEGPGGITRCTALIAEERDGQLASYRVLVSR